jgi:hypothetical protein
MTKNNCYNYACDIMTDTYAHPGHAQGIFPPSPSCSNTGDAAVADGLIKVQVDPQEPHFYSVCEECTHLVALFISSPVQPGDPTTYQHDYHWYRLDDNGKWSYKFQEEEATNRDASGDFIYDPRSADRVYLGAGNPPLNYNYEQFCDFYCVDKKIVEIK